MTVCAVGSLLSPASACLVTNPSFDGPAPGSTSTSVTGPVSATEGSSTTSSTEAPTTTGSSDAASTVGVDSSSPESSTGTSTGDLDVGTSTGEEMSATTGEGEDSLTLEASRTYLPQAMEYPGVLTLDVPTPVKLPSTLMVKVGNAGNHKTTLTLTLPNMDEVECSYTGGSNEPNPVPEDPSEWDKGLSVLFTGCSDGSMADDMHTVVKLRLDIKNGASMQPPGKPRTTVVAVLPKKG